MAQEEGNDEVAVVDADSSGSGVNRASLWPPSPVTPKATIFKTRGMEKYVLKPADIEHLDYEEIAWPDKESPDKDIVGHRYLERDLEEVARKKYGSPGAMEAARQAPIIAREEKEARATALAEMEADLKGTGKGWLWEMVVNRVRTNRMKEILSSTATLAARDHFIPSYPSRPEGYPMDRPHHQSQSFARLYKVLSASDKPVADRASGVPNAKPTRNFRWDAAYNKKSYEALFEITEEHGREGWKEARWIVYDQYAKRRYGKVTLKQIGTDNEPQWQWSDPAAFWLNYEEYKMAPERRVLFLKFFETPEA